MKPYLEKYNVETIADLFCGSGAISRMLFQDYNVISNDIMYFASTITRAQLSACSIDEYKFWIDHLNHIEPKKGFVTKEYSPEGLSGRKFFSQKTATKIDAMRAEIENIKTSISTDLYYKLLGTLIHYADKHANVASVYGAFLKDFKDTALKDFELKPCFNLFPSDHSRKSIVLNQDILTLDINKIEWKIDAVYLDPPYNQRSYSKNYSPLETIAKYDNPEIKGKTGLRTDSGDFSGVFCKKSKIKDGMEKMLKVLKDVPLIFMSYSNEGLLSESQIKEICVSANRKVECIKISYDRFASKKNQKRDVQEYLFVIE
jgi:adenine-specific DNA-methyltransferase